MKTVEAPKKRILASNEIKLMETLKEALIGKALAEVAMKTCRQTIGRMTQEISKLDITRARAVWVEALKLAKEKTR